MHDVQLIVSALISAWILRSSLSFVDSWVQMEE